MKEFINHEEYLKMLGSLAFFYFWFGSYGLFQTNFLVWPLSSQLSFAA